MPIVMTLLRVNGISEVQKLLHFRNKRYMPLYAVWFNNKIITGCCENGNLYILDDNYYREDLNAEHSLPLYSVRQTPVITADYNLLFILSAFYRM